MRERTTNALRRLICRLPLNPLRIRLLNLTGYSIAPSAHVSRGAVLNAASVEIGPDARVGRVHFLGPCRVVVGARANVSGTVYCGDWAGDNYARECVFGEDVYVRPEHYLDATNGIHIGAHSWLAGTGSQLWTHGFKGGPIRIGEYCYLGSAVLISPGVTLPDRTLVGMGSVVTSSVEESGCLIGGNPAVVLKRNHERILRWKAE